MAKALSALEKPSDPFGGITQAKYLEFLERYATADKAVSEAVADRKDLRAAIKAAGIPLKAFDRAQRDAGVSGEVRENEELWYRRMMAWRAKPVGFQPVFDFSAKDAGTAALNVAELKRIDNEGIEAGRKGHLRTSNSYTPGTEAYQRWDTAWLRGQGDIASTMAPAAKRGPGRPRGSGTKTETTALTVREGGAAPDPGPTAEETRH
jgi:hypothetical protein